MPAVVAAGDTLIILITLDSTPTLTTPSGWSLLTPVGSNLDVLGIYTRVSDGTEGGTTVNVASSNSQEGCAQAWRIANGSTVFSTTMTTGSSTTPDPPNLAPGIGTRDFLWIAAMCCDNDSAGTITSFPTNYASNQTDTVTSAGSATLPTLGAAARTLTASSENPGTFTIASDGWVAATVAVAPFFSIPVFQRTVNRIWVRR
jgi:hypothetical protein